MSIQIQGYIFQTCFIHLIIFFVYPPLFVSISCLSISISSHLFVNLDWCLSLYISLSIQLDAYLFQPHFLYLGLILIYPPVSIFILFYPPLSLSVSCLSKFTYISFYPLSILLYFSLSFYKSKFMPISFNPVFFISVYSSYIHLYICFYLLSIHPYFFIPLCQSGLMPISLYLFVNPTWCISLSTPLSLSQPNPHLSACIYLYSFLSTTISFCLLFIQIYIYLFLFLVYSPLFISIFL